MSWNEGFAAAFEISLELLLHVLRERRQIRFRQLMMDLGLIDYFRDTSVWNDYCQPLGEDDFDCSLSGPAQEHSKLVSSTG
jgi:hypothetical protein